ncbi:MAG: 3-deoxy-manno-octulosonate cytidylyltransferase [Candidatus Puniceispirillum sp.]|nr:3-deoxy-manno-octulosonate cytidylyltransferase [Candidatus Puniceispirillum sp.]
MNPLIVIPARLASTRLPGKMLADVGGKPLIQHVFERCASAKAAPVLVACDSEEIAQVIRGVGGEVVLTDPDLPSGSDRVWAGVNAYDPDGVFDTIINVQGDQPLLEQTLLGHILRPLVASQVDIATLAAPFDASQDANAPQAVKVVLGGQEEDPVRRALYFSRACVPYGAKTFYHHIGIYAYRRKVLNRFVKLAPTLLETTESLEQLRALEAGMRMDACIVNAVPMGVDTHQDLDHVRQQMEQGR